MNIENKEQGSKEENYEANPDTQKALDSFFAHEWIKTDPEARDESFDLLTRTLARQEGFNPDAMDLNHKFSSNDKMCDLEVIDMNSSTGEYYMKLEMSNKLTEDGEDRPKSYKFKYHIKVSPEVFKKYTDKLSI